MIDIFDENQFKIIELAHTEQVAEFKSSEEYIKKLKTKISSELMILSPIVPLIVMLFLPEASKINMYIKFVLFFGAIPPLFKIYEFYRNLLFNAYERKIIFNNNSISILNEKTECEPIKYIDIFEIHVGINQDDRSIEQINLHLKDINKMTKVVNIEGYDKTSTILQIVINNMRLSQQAFTVDAGQRC